jgi:16S rRNA (guanine527-N7)-methyltransferase
MTHTLENEFDLINELLSYGICITQRQATTLLYHLDLVIAKNKYINLTRINDLQSGITKHIVDSLIILPSLFPHLNSECNFVDIGTGAGYPGIPIAIATNWNGVLVDSVTKKTTAVKEFVNELNLSGLTVSNSRIEDYSARNRNKFDLAIARALADIAVIMEYSSPLLKIGGYLALTKGNPTDIELNNADRVSSICGFKLVSRETYSLPNNCGTRNIFVYKKYKDASISLPRHIGFAKNRPLYN